MVAYVPHKCQSTEILAVEKHEMTEEENSHAALLSYSETCL